MARCRAVDGHVEGERQLAVAVVGVAEVAVALGDGAWGRGWVAGVDGHDDGAGAGCCGGRCCADRSARDADGDLDVRRVGAVDVAWLALEVAVAILLSFVGKVGHGVAGLVVGALCHTGLDAAS